MRTRLYEAIARALRADIAEGRYPSGAKLPTEAALAERFGVNRHTVRHALEQLAAQGLVRSRRGAGTFVLARHTDYPIGKRVRFHQNLLAAGRSPDKRVLHVETRGATAVEAERLALRPGEEICVYRALSLADGDPIALVESHFPEARLPGLAAQLATVTGVTIALKAVGVADYTRASTRISARAADATQAAQLRLSEGAPLVYATGLNIDPDGAPVEFGRTWFAGDKVTLTLEDQ